MCIRNAACGLNHSVRLELHAERDRERCSKREGGGRVLGGRGRVFAHSERERERERMRAGERYTLKFCMYRVSVTACACTHKYTRVSDVCTCTGGGCVAEGDES
jgi:hypothetical protein